MRRRFGWCASLSERVKLLGLGAGGHAKVVLDALTAMEGFEVVGLLDPREDLWGSKVAGVTVLGGDDLLDEHPGGARHAFLGLGVPHDTAPRRRLWEAVIARGYDVVSVVHPTAVVSPQARVGRGATVFAAAVVNAGAELGANVIVNTGAIVEHDCRLADHVHLAVGAVLGSGVVVEEGAHVGAGATVLQRVTVGARAVVGAGAVVIRDVDADVVVVGVPARVLRERIA